MTILVTGAFVGLTLWRTDFHRPLEHDELITLRHYTWAGVFPNGQSRPLTRIEDIEQLERPCFRQLVIGLYCGFGRWPEPNNHVVNSVFINLVTAAAGVSKATLRLPALIGAVALCIALFWVGVHTFRWRMSACVVVLLAMGCPYVHQFSQTARGYTWMLALQVLQLALLLELRKRTGSITLGAASVICAVLSFMNVVTMSVFWVLPVYLVMWFVRPDEQDSLLGPAPSVLWRRNLLVQALCIGAIGLVFLLDRLPYIYSSATQYGHTFSTLRQGVALFYSSIQYLLPFLGWQLVGMLGVVGLVMGSRRSNTRAIAMAAVLSFVVVLAQALISRRMAYSHVYGHVLPILMLAAVWGGEAIIQLAKSTSRRVVVSSLLIVAAITLVGSTAIDRLEDEKLTRLLQRLSQLPRDETVQTLALCEAGIPSTASLYFPRLWQQPGTLERVAAGQKVRLTVVAQSDDSGDWAVDVRSAQGQAKWWPGDWPSEHLFDVDRRYRCIQLNGRADTIESVKDLATPAVVLWHPNRDSVAVTPQRIYDHLATCNVKYLTLNERYQAKLEVFNRLAAVMLLGETATELSAIRQLLATADDELWRKSLVITFGAESADVREAP